MLTDLIGVILALAVTTTTEFQFSVFIARFRIKTSDKKRRFDLSEIIFKL